MSLNIVDVRDVATAHIIAMEMQNAAQQLEIVIFLTIMHCG